MTGCCDALEAGNEEAQQENFGEAREGTVWRTHLTWEQRPYHFHRALAYYVSSLSRQHAPNAHPASQFGAFFATFPSVKATLGVLPLRITGSVNIKACFRPVFYYFLAPTAQKTWPRCQARVELGNFSLFRPELSVASSTREAEKHDHNSTVPHEHSEVFLHTSSVTRVSRCFFGTRPNLRWSLESRIFLFWKRGLFLPLPSPNSQHMSLVNFMSATIQHYRHEYPTEDF